MVIDGLQPEDIIGNRFAGEGYAFFRLPDAGTYTYIAQRGMPEELDAFARLGNKEGVVIAPFVQTATTPLILISPDVSLEGKVPDVSLSLPAAVSDDAAAQKVFYDQGFDECLRRLQTGELRKVVYSRRLTVALSSAVANPVDLFFKACRLQPHCYVSLWWTRRTGCWLVATPETLLSADEAKDGLWHTMALAATMPWRGSLLPAENWSRKNQEEQAYVVNYIKRQLDGLVGDGVQTDGRRAVRAGNVMHLRTDFSFRLKRGVRLGALLGRLHPTPAVCGEPLLLAKSAIRAAEATPRRYYAGFSGPLGVNGHTGLYVSLRCMELAGQRAMLYAGGGLLAESRLDDEWDETCRKLQPMLQLFQETPM